MTTEPPLITARRIIAWVASRYGLSDVDIRSRCRRFNIYVWPRWMAIWLIRKHTPLSLSEIQHELGFTVCTSVFHAVKSVDDRMACDPVRRQEVEELELAWKERA